MTDNTNHSQQADIKAARSLSAIWLVPLVALIIGGWMVYYQWANQGPEIQIEFESAEGLEAGKTKIKARNVDVGEVTQIRLKKSNDGVLVSARMNKEAEHLLNADSQFWVVSPRVSISEVSGLTTLLSGPYIELSPGQSNKTKTRFTGLEEPPVTPQGTPGLFVTLNSDDEFAYGRGDPITYKGLTVGKVEDIFFNIEERVVYYNAFIEAPYHQLVTHNTRFWNVSGVRLELKSDGISVHTGNVETLLTNGIAFGVPDNMPKGERVTERAYFDIYPDYEKASEARYKEEAHFVMLISDTVRGLNVGAPVEYRGLPVGKVKSIDMSGAELGNILNEDYRIPVLFSIQPGRVGLPDNAEGLDHVKVQTRKWIKQGLKASLQTGNLLTGAQFVELQFYPQSTQGSVERFDDYLVIPAISDEFTQITQKVSAILDKFNAIEMNKLATDTQQMVTEFTQTAKTFRQASADFSQLSEDLDTRQLTANLNRTLSQLNQLLRDYGADSQTYDGLNRTLESLNRMMRDLKPLIMQLNHTPNSLIFTGAEEDDPEPQAKEPQS
ncbi:Paraquat-inducible protein [Saliniradius amylolyticus]|uniref:Paraquat-inducible protein n=1 Tax=Saliniradius amylolyticus TaxID=2183582 RepID=A0A2S2E3B6_9ALTE|nr:intermembrane transport protein PqiB [Saliniradius amylolyticus]AWL12145.1 Paraquat-inducible protein [Saliniradius amylolyticus]